MAIVCRKTASQCAWDPDDEDVLGHAAIREVTATVTITVSEDADGEEVLRISADDPEVEELLASRLVAIR
jgi:voltage-gated potassium channel Kch